MSLRALTLNRGVLFAEDEAGEAISSEQCHCEKRSSPLMEKEIAHLHLTQVQVSSGKAPSSQ